MEVAFYNETLSRLNLEVEIYHAFVFSLFADKIYLRCHNSTWYQLVKQKDRWNDTMFMALYEYFENAHSGKYALHYKDFDQVYAELKRAKKFKQKTKDEFHFVQTGNLLKKNMKDIFVDNLNDILHGRRVHGLQKLVDNDVIKMYSLLSNFNSGQYNLYIKEIRDIFMEFDDYQVFAESVKAIYKLLKPEQLQAGTVPDDTYDKPEVISIELLDFPLLSDIGPEHIYYLRSQLFPKFADFRKQLDLFRDEISNIQFLPENFEKMIGLFQQQIGKLLPSIQEVIEQQLFIQLTRKLYMDFGFKLNMCIASVSAMIDYFPQSGIVPQSIADAARRMLNRETDLNRSELFFYIDFYTPTGKF